ncbi:transcription repressor OFP13-like [Quercus suber]|uniref:Transcription repressor n=1 Tax=Quercus suber TaxID=58331 RepID=A0AAW0I9U1_QUESU|nr:transcription repressor OFP13 [Quercus suber]
MGKKMKLPFPFKSTDIARPPWPWYCHQQPRTLSFRTNCNDNIYKTVNSIFLDTAIEVVGTTESCFTNSSESPSFSTTSEDSGVDPVETVIRGLKSQERLFFKPEETSSILEEAKESGFPYKESVVLSMDSQDPFVDFRKSMEEMVEAHGVKDWEGLEELLCWYLRVNDKSNRGYIVGAFVDLLVSLAFANSSSTCSCSHSHSPSPSSPLSLYTSSSFSSSTAPCVSSLEVEEDSDSTPCLSSLLECEKEIKDNEDDSSSSLNV